MKELPFRKSNRGKVLKLKLGKVYQVTDTWDKKNICLFINTSKKGFNFLNLKNAKCLFKRVLYQEDSAGKKIGRSQTVFYINVPDHVEKIEELTTTEIKNVRFFSGMSFYAPSKTLSEHKKEERVKEKQEGEDFAQSISDNSINSLEI